MTCARISRSLRHSNRTYHRAGIKGVMDSQDDIKDSNVCNSNTSNSPGRKDPLSLPPEATVVQGPSRSGCRGRLCKQDHECTHDTSGLSCSSTESLLSTEQPICRTSCQASLLQKCYGQRCDLDSFSLVLRVGAAPRHDLILLSLLQNELP